MNASSIRIETVEKTPGASPYTVHFKVLAPEDAMVAAYSWCFGDGNTSTVREPTHTYYSDTVQGNDNYHAVLTVAFIDGTTFRSAPVPTLVKDKQGGQDVSENKLLPLAKFDANRTSGPAPLDVRFICQSEYAGSGYSSSGQLSQWYIDGTNVGEGKYLEYRFNDAGEYNVTLVVRNDNGTDSASETISVTTAQPIATVSFEANPMLGEAPLTVSFTDTSVVPYETSWIWDFGDGTPMVEYSQYVDHQYQAAGNYTVTLTHSGAEAAPISATRTIVVTEPTGEKIYPVADFTLNVTSGPAPLLVGYHDQSLNATDVYWEFGLEEDQVVSHETSPLRDGVVLLREPGVYTVRLTATNQNGTDTKLGSISVTDGSTGGVEDEEEDDGGNEIIYLPDASFTASAFSGEEPLVVTFVNTSANTTSVEWFVDGIFITEEDEMDYIFLESGDYNVTLVAHNGTYADQAFETIVVGTDPTQPESHPPIADFSANQTVGEAPLSVQFTDESVNATDVIWTFELNGAEAGESSFERDPVYSFTLPGSYTVTLYALNADGMDEKTMSIEVTKGQVVIPDPEPPIAQFDANVTQGTAPLSVGFTDLSVSATEIRWYVDGDYAGNGPELAYRFDQSGRHLVVLIASNGRQFSSASKIITVKDPASGNGGDDYADDEENPANGGDDTDDQDDHADDDNVDDNADDGSPDEGDDTDDQADNQEDEGDDGADGQDGHDADDDDKCPGESADETDDSGCDEQKEKDECSDRNEETEPEDECADKKEDKCAPKPAEDKCIDKKEDKCAPKPTEDKCIDKKEDKCAPKPTEDKCADIEEKPCAPVDACPEQEETADDCEEQEIDSGEEQETAPQCDDQPGATEEAPVETPTGEGIAEESPVETEECDDQQEVETPAPAPSEGQNNSC